MSKSKSRVETRDEGESREPRRRHAKSNEDESVSTKLVFRGRDIKLIYKETGGTGDDRNVETSQNIRS